MTPQTTSPIRIIVLAIVATLGLIAAGALIACSAEEPRISQAQEEFWTRWAHAAAPHFGVPVQAPAPDADEPQRPTIHVMLITVFTADGKLLSGSDGPYSSAERCHARAIAEAQKWAQRRAIDVTPACAKLYVPQAVLDDLVAKEAAPARAPAPTGKGDGLTL